MKYYKGWSPAERLAMAAQTRAARARGEIPEAFRCNRCGQTRGKIMYHNHDYSHPTKFLEQLCWRCHMMLHSEHRAPAQVERYFARVKAGERWPPVYKHDFTILERDHGVPNDRAKTKGKPSSRQRDLGEF